MFAEHQCYLFIPKYPLVDSLSSMDVLLVLVCQQKGLCANMMNTGITDRFI